MAVGYVEIHLQRSMELERDDEGFVEQVEQGSNMAAYNAARRGASLANALYGASGLGWHIDIFASGGQGDWDITARGQWAEAAEFGIPDHSISTEKWSLYNEDYPFPSVIDERFDRPAQIQHVNHPGVMEVGMIGHAGDEIADSFEGILVSHLP